MQTEAFDSILQNITRHTTLSDLETSHFIEILKRKNIKRKHFLLQSGEICQTENFIIKGLLRAYTVDDRDHEHNLMFGMEDWWISDLYSFVTSTPSTMNIEALEDTEVFCIEKEALETLYTTLPKFERVMRLLFQNAFVAQQQRILASISQTAEERYSNFINRYPALEQRIPQTMIASYLGMTPETLSRIRKQWSR